VSTGTFLSRERVSGLRLAVVTRAATSPAKIAVSELQRMGISILRDARGLPVMYCARLFVAVEDVRIVVELPGVPRG
jgi:hypothetical protein